MNNLEIEKSLCILYKKAVENQKIDKGYACDKQLPKFRINNLDRQYLPYNMRELCKKHEL